MTKKIFKIIGIVLGSVTAFVGVVVGIMALQGKFKKPVVYPTRLSFMQSEQTIVVTNDTNKVYSFVLNGFADNSEYDVNQKSSYLNFVNNTGSNLITLCDKNGKSLKNDSDRYDSSKNRYIIECNEPTYFKVNPADAQNFTGDTFGRVVLQATDSRSLVQSNTLTIWIDREVKSILLDDNLAEISNQAGELTQTLELGLEVKEYFNFTATPEFSLYPFRGKTDANGNELGKKKVELYYHDMSEFDYVPIDKDSVSKYSFLGYDEEQGLYFKHDEAVQTPFEFKIAVFPTYEAQQAFDSDPQNAYIANHQRINQMVHTTLLINVENSEVEEVGFRSQGISLNLFENNNRISLRDETNLTGNLGLYMIREGAETTKRFNEVDFNLNAPENWSNSELSFEDDESQYLLTYSNDRRTFTFNTTTYTNFDFDLDRGIITLRDNNGNTAHSFTLTLMDAKLGENTFIISNVRYNNASQIVDLKPSTGALVAETVRDNVGGTHVELRRLSSGSYLSFYAFNRTTGKYTLTTSEQFNYTASYIANSTGANRSFNILVKSSPTLSENEELALGLLVVNSNGGALFANISVNVVAVDLLFDLVRDTLDLDVEYQPNGEGYETIFKSTAFADLVKITQGSYTAGVFVTERADHYNVDVLDGVYYSDGRKDYVLVGYISDGKFVNAVRARAGANQSATNLYVLQLKNAYGQTAEEIIQNLLENEEIYLRYSFAYTIADETKNYYTYIKLTNDNGTLSATAGNIYDETNAQVGGLSISEVVLSDTLQLKLTDNGVVNAVLDAVNLGFAGENSIQISENSLVKPVKVETNEKFITATVKFPFVTNGIEFNYNAGNLGSTVGNDEYVNANIVNGKLDSISVVEDTTSHTLTLKSPIDEMFANMVNAGLSKENVTIRLYNQNGYQGESQNIVINSIEASFAGELVLNYDVDSSLPISTNYLKIAITFDGTTIETEPIYILSTDATDITFTYNNDGAQNVNLYSTTSDAENGNHYLKITLDYDTDYTYAYSLMEKRAIEDVVLKDFGEEAIFNAVSSKDVTNGFVVAPLYGDKTQDLEFTSLTPAVLDFVSGLNVKSVGKATLAVRSGSVTKYIQVVVTTDNLTYRLKSFNPPEGNQFDLTTVVEMQKADGSSILSSSTTTVENLTGVMGGGQTLQGKEVGNVLSLQTNGGVTVLEVVELNNQWTFVRKNMSSSQLRISFDVVSKLGRIPVNVNFVSNVQVNPNADWGNFYQGTTVALYEESKSATGTFNNNPIFKIVNTTMGSQVVDVTITTPSGQIVENKTGEYTFDELGSYQFKFKLDGSVVEELSLTIRPNIIVTENNTNLKTNSSYAISEIFNLQSYNTNPVYGKKSGENTPMYTDENLVALNSDYDLNKINITSNMGIGSNRSLLSQTTDARIDVKWNDDLLLNQTETLTLGYVDNSNEYTLAEHDVTITNKYKAEISTAQIDIVAGIPIDNANFNFVNDANFTLSSISYSPLTETQISAEFNKAGEQFVATLTSSNGKVDKLNNARLTLTYVGNVDGVERTLSIIIDSVNDETLPNVTIAPFVPTEKEFVAYSQAESENNFDLIGAMFGLDDATFTSLVSRFVVSDVSDNSAFLGNVSDFINTGYNSGATVQGCYVHFAEISGASKTITLTFLLTYNNGTTYQFTKELTINNRLYIETNYPFQGLTVEREFIITDPLNENIKTDLDATHLSVNRYTVRTNYEVVNIGETIYFDNDEIFSIDRAQVKDARSKEAIKDGYTLSIAGYSNSGNLANYVNSGAITKPTSNSLRFNSNASYFQPNQGGYLLVKVTSSSGFIKYYGLYLYNQNNTQYSDADYTTSLTKQANSNTFVDKTNRTILGVELSSGADDFKNLTFTETTFNNIEVYLLDGSLLNGSDFYASTGLAANSKVNDLTLSSQLNYAHLKLGLLYNRSTSKVYLGSLDVYVKPVLAEQKTNTKFTDLITGISTGEYNYTIASSESEIPNPFTVGLDNNPAVKIVSIDSSNNFQLDENKISSVEAGDIVAIDGTKVVVKQNITEQLKFTVSYSFATDEDETKFVVLVHYTINNINISESTYYDTLGEFDETTGFNNSLSLDNVLNGYKKRIKIITDDNASEETAPEIDLADADYLTNFNVGDVNVNYADNKLIFTLGTAEYRCNFRIKLLDVVGTPSRDVQITVKAGIYVPNFAGGAGYSESSPLESTINDSNLYKRADASEITIEKTPVGENPDKPLYYKHTVGGLTIYTSDNSAPNIDIYSDIANLVKKLDDNQPTWSFVHMGEDNKVVRLPITINNGLGNYQITDSGVSTDLVINLYVRIAKTYDSLKANYLATGLNDELVVDHENVKQNTTIENLFETMFGVVENSTEFKKLNSNRMSLIFDKKVVDDADFNAMGFNSSDNANHIIFSASDFNVTGNTARFGAVSRDTLATLFMTNNAGVSASYTYQIMANDVNANGINPATNSLKAFTETTGADDTYKAYSVIQIDDGDDYTEEMVYAKSEELLMQLMDGRNRNFFINNVKLVELDNTTKDIEVGDPVQQDGNLIYTITVDGYTIKIQISAQNRVYVSFERVAGASKFERLHLSMDLYSDSGKIVKDFSLVFANYTIGLMPDAVRSVRAGDDIKLSEVFEIKSNIDNTSSGNSISLAGATIIDGRYSLNGQTHGIGATDGNIDCNVFTYNKNNQILTTKSVPDSTNVTLTIRVSTKINGTSMVVAQCDYTFTITRNLKFAVNGQELLEGAEEIETYYIMTEQNHVNRDGKFYTFGYEEAGNNTLEGSSTNINVQLLNMSGTPITVNNAYTITQITNYDLTIDSVNKTITFNEDITGDVEFMLSAPTGANGSYSVKWVLHVTGFVDLQYTNLRTGANNIQHNVGGLGFKSQASVIPIDTTNTQASQNGTGVLINSTLGEERLPVATNNNIYATYQYKILPNNSTISVNDVFNEDFIADGDNGEHPVKLNESKQLKLILPTVEQSSPTDPRYFLVAYRIQLHYFANEEGRNALGNTKFVYVTYQVSNDQTISSDLKDSVNVDNSGMITSSENNNDKFLNLFDTTYTYTLEDGEKITISYQEDATSKNYNLVYKNETYLLDTAGETEYTFTNDDKSITFNLKDNSIKITESGVDTIYSTPALEKSNANVVFASNRNNIFEMVSDLNSISKVNFRSPQGLVDDLASTNPVALNLVHIANGRWGVKIYDSTATELKDKSPLKFKASEGLSADMCLSSNSGDMFVLREFKLSTDNKIEAKTSGITLGNIFLSSEMEKGEYRNQSVIGIGTPDASWVNVDDVSITTMNNVDGKPFDTMTLANGRKFDLKQVLFNTNEGAEYLYSMASTFFYIEPVGEGASSEITTIDYSWSNQPGYYQINLPTPIPDGLNEDGTIKYTYPNSIFDIYNDSNDSYVLVTYKMGNAIDDGVDNVGKLIKKVNNLTIAQLELVSSTEQITYHSDTGRLTLSEGGDNSLEKISDKTIFFTYADLLSYKQANPNKSSISVNFEINLGDAESDELGFRVEFILPELN